MGVRRSTLLHKMVMWKLGHGKTFDKLIKSGAQVNLTAPWSVLHVAMEVGNEDIIRRIVLSDSDINTTHDSGSTALHFAAQNNLESMAKLLLELGADLWIRDREGLTAMDTAALAGNYEAYLAFLESVLHKKNPQSDLPNQAFLSAVDLLPSAILKHIGLICSTGNHDFLCRLISNQLVYSALTSSSVNEYLQVSAASASQHTMARETSLQQKKHFKQVRVEIYKNLVCTRQVAQITQPASTDQESSKRIHKSMSTAGFTSANAAVQSGAAAFLEKILNEREDALQERKYFVVGSFADGWGSCLSGISGQIDKDSDIDVTVIESRLTFHLAGTKDHTSSFHRLNCKNVEYSDGHIRHGDYISIDVKNPNMRMTGNHLRPSIDLVRAYPCCEYPEFEVLQPECKSNIPKDILDSLQKDTQCHVVAAAPPGKEGERMRVSTTLLERKLMQSLSTLQGQLFIILKYLIKRVIAKRVKGLKTYHAKNLLFYMLEKTPADEWQPHNLIKLLRQSLQLLLDSLTDVRSSEHQCMWHFFMRDAAVYLRQDPQPNTQLKKKIALVIREVLDGLPELLIQFEQTLMKNSPDGIAFHPFLILPIIKDLPVSESEETVCSYSEIYDVVKQALLLLGKQIIESEEECQLRDLKKNIKQLPYCTVIVKESLKALMQLRKWESYMVEEDEQRDVDLEPLAHVFRYLYEQFKKIYEIGRSFPLAFVSFFLVHIQKEQIPFPSFSDFTVENAEIHVSNFFKKNVSVWKFMFKFDEDLEFAYLPDHIRKAFPWKLSKMSHDSVYINFSALAKALSLEFWAQDGHEVTSSDVEKLFSNAFSGNADPQELLMVLHYCCSEDLLVKAIHSNSDMISATGLRGHILTFLDSKPLLRHSCAQATWDRVEDKIKSQRQLNTREELQRIDLVVEKVRDFIRQLHPLNGLSEAQLD